MAKVLIIDDEEEVRLGLAEVMEDAKHESVMAADGHEGMRMLKKRRPDLILLDVRMPHMGGLEFLLQMKEMNLVPNLPVLILTAHVDAHSTIEAMRLGAFDFLLKPIGREELLQAVALALSTTQKQHSSPPANAEESAPGSTTVGEFVGASEVMRTVQKAVGLAARSDATVLISGETGTGKEMVARLLHRYSTRERSPFVAINCSAIPAELLESTLFGHKRGAFSGAVSDRPGCFEQAHGGCLFLDEIGDMPPTMQSKLLRVLQEKEITPVGGSEVKTIDVRIFAASHRDLPESIKKGEFRSDLFYRLDVIRIHLPPLRERIADILPLAESFLRQIRSTKKLSRSAAQYLLNHTWPGNVRELRNAIERAAAASRGPAIEAKDLGLRSSEDLAAHPFPSDVDSSPGTLAAILARVEKRAIEQALIASGYNRAEAARSLGIRRQYLYDRMKKLQIDC